MPATHAPRASLPSEPEGPAARRATERPRRALAGGVPGYVRQAGRAEPGAEQLGPGLAGTLIDLLTAPIAMVVDAISFVVAASVNGSAVGSAPQVILYFVDALSLSVYGAGRGRAGVTG